MPRPNLYQSLHTTVIDGGQPFQFRFAHKTCTAESLRKVSPPTGSNKDRKPGAGDDDQRIAWMRQLIEWSQELQEPGEFLSTLKVDLAPVEVYAFTPKGRVLELPKARHFLPFAYSVQHRSGPPVCRAQK